MCHCQTSTLFIYYNKQKSKEGGEYRYGVMLRNNPEYHFSKLQNITTFGLKTPKINSNRKKGSTFLTSVRHAVSLVSIFSRTENYLVYKAKEKG